MTRTKKHSKTGHNTEANHHGGEGIRFRRPGDTGTGESGLDSAPLWGHRVGRAHCSGRECPQLPHTFALFTFVCVPGGRRAAGPWPCEKFEFCFCHFRFSFFVILFAFGVCYFVGVPCFVFSFVSDGQRSGVFARRLAGRHDARATTQVVSQTKVGPIVGHGRPTFSDHLYGLTDNLLFHFSCSRFVF